MKIVAGILFSISFAMLTLAFYQWVMHRARGHEDARRRLRESVQDLPGWQPTLVVMHVEDRYNYLEIAAKLEMPAQFVLSELAKAYATLRVRQLEQETPRRTRWENVRARLIFRLIGG